MIGVRVKTADIIEAGRLEELYQRHVSDAVRLAYLLTGDRALAEDLVQDAFLKLFGRYRDLRDPQAFPWYLRRTVVNLARSNFRKRRVERAYAQGPGRPVNEEVLGPDVESRDLMWRSLFVLPERQRAALVLRYYEDLSEAKIAEVLRCPEGTVRSLISRGTQALRAVMQGGESDDR